MASILTDAPWASVAPSAGLVSAQTGGAALGLTAMLTAAELASAPESSVAVAVMARRGRRSSDRIYSGGRPVD
ncbi:MAG TPA: hypothetical protein VD861_21590 [Pyrinomonadaceae bacterium]|nr:hypothetical protein [Pyrinomonadaceae bacterium]